MPFVYLLNTTWTITQHQERGPAVTNRWRKRVRNSPLQEILLWVTHEAPPRALQTSECSELLNPTRTSCVILAQRQPGKLLICVCDLSQHMLDLNLRSNHPSNLQHTKTHKDPPCTEVTPCNADLAFRAKMQYPALNLHHTKAARP